MGFTRAQTLQILLSSFALELVVICVQYAHLDVINLDAADIITAGVVAAVTCTPASLLFIGAFRCHSLVGSSDGEHARSLSALGRGGQGGGGGAAEVAAAEAAAIRLKYARAEVSSRAPRRRRRRRRGRRRRRSDAEAATEEANHSLRRALRKRDWRRMACVGIGWASNWLLFVLMLLVFVIYGCRLQSINFGGIGLDAALLLSWAWSAAQRFLVHEPL